ncbi:unnamed protein product [Closterium sp. NIES-54]
MMDCLQRSRRFPPPPPPLPHQQQQFPWLTLLRGFSTNSHRFPRRHDPRFTPLGAPFLAAVAVIAIISDERWPAGDHPTAVMLAQAELISGMSLPNGGLEHSMSLLRVSVRLKCAMNFEYAMSVLRVSLLLECILRRLKDSLLIMCTMNFEYAMSLLRMGLKTRPFPPSPFPALSPPSPFPSPHPCNSFLRIPSPPRPPYRTLSLHQAPCALALVHPIHTYLATHISSALPPFPSSPPPPSPTLPFPPSCPSPMPRFSSPLPFPSLPPPTPPPTSPSRQSWETLYGLSADSPLPPSAISLLPSIPPPPHLEPCSARTAVRQAAERRVEGGALPPWAQDNAACGNVPQPPWVRGSDSSNLASTRVAQRDIWAHQFPPPSPLPPHATAPASAGDGAAAADTDDAAAAAAACEGKRFLLVQWPEDTKSTSNSSSTTTGSSSNSSSEGSSGRGWSHESLAGQLQGMSVALRVAFTSGRVLVPMPGTFQPARHPHCQALNASGSLHCYFFRPVSHACEASAMQHYTTSTAGAPPCKPLAHLTAQQLGSNETLICSALSPPTPHNLPHSLPSLPPHSPLTPSSFPQAHWWHSQALRFLLRWPSPSFCRTLSHHRSSAPSSPPLPSPPSLRQAHWWTAQALRFLLRWPSPSLCHTLNRHRSSALGPHIASLSSSLCSPTHTHVSRTPSPHLTPSFSPLVAPKLCVSSSIFCSVFLCPLQAHWWTAQALRFLLRWPSPSLCHALNRHRSSALGPHIASLSSAFLTEQHAIVTSLLKPKSEADQGLGLDLRSEGKMLKRLNLSAHRNLETDAWPSLGFSGCLPRRNRGKVVEKSSPLTVYQSVGREAYLLRPIVSIHLAEEGKQGGQGQQGQQGGQGEQGQQEEQGQEQQQGQAIQEGQEGKEAGNSTTAETGSSSSSSSNASQLSVPLVSALLLSYQLRRREPGLKYVWLSTDQTAATTFSPNHLSRFADWTFLYPKPPSDPSSSPAHYDSMGAAFGDLLVASESDFFVGDVGSRWSRLIYGLKCTNGRLYAGPAGASPRLSSQQLREWLVQRAHCRSGAPGAGEPGGAGAGGAAVTTRAGDPTEPGAAGAGGAGAGVAGVGGPGAGGAGGAGAGAVDPGAEGAGGTVRPRPYFAPLLEQVLGVPSSTGLPPPFVYPPPDQSQPPLQPASPLPVPSPYTEQSRGLTERREPASRPVSPVRPARRAPRSCPPPVPGTHTMALRPSSVPLRVPLPTPPDSSLPADPDPESDRARATSPTVARLLASAVTDPSFESAAASALVAELLDFAAAYRLDYASALVAESVPAIPASVGGECALGTDVLEDRQEDFECLAAAVPRFASFLLAPEGDPDAPDIPTPRSYAEAIEGPYSSQWQAAMDAEMASWKSTSTYVDEVPPPGVNIVDGMRIFRVKRPPGSPPAFKARYVARGFCQTTFLALGFVPSTADPLLFLRTDTSLPPFYVLVYVDDLVFATADTDALTLVKSELQKRHTCTDLGELRSYLGLQITRDRARRTITLSQSHMVHQVLQRFGFQYSSPQLTPLSTSHSLSAPPSDESVELSGPYPELVGCLMYLMTCTRPDLVYPLSLLAYYVAPGRHRKVHWDAAKRVLRYLSSCEAEIYAGAMAAQELRWLTYLLTDLGEQPRSPPVLYVDNKAMIAWCQEHRLEHRTKHIALRYFLARELQLRGQLRLAYVATRANTADVFTKALPPGDHQRFVTVLGLVPTLPHLLTA